MLNSRPNELLFVGRTRRGSADSLPYQAFPQMERSFLTQSSLSLSRPSLTSISVRPEGFLSHRSLVLGGAETARALNHFHLPMSSSFVEPPIIVRSSRNTTTEEAPTKEHRFLESPTLLLDAKTANFLRKAHASKVIDESSNPWSTVASDLQPSMTSETSRHFKTQQAFLKNLSLQVEHRPLKEPLITKVDRAEKFEASGNKQAGPSTSTSSDAFVLHEVKLAEFQLERERKLATELSLKNSELLRELGEAKSAQNALALQLESQIQLARSLAERADQLEAIHIEKSLKFSSELDFSRQKIKTLEESLRIQGQALQAEKCKAEAPPVSIAPFLERQLAELESKNTILVNENLILAEELRLEREKSEALKRSNPHSLRKESSLTEFKETFSIQESLQKARDMETIRSGVESIRVGGLYDSLDPRMRANPAQVDQNASPTRSIKGIIQEDLFSSRREMAKDSLEAEKHKKITREKEKEKEKDKKLRNEVEALGARCSELERQLAKSEAKTKTLSNSRPSRAEANDDGSLAQMLSLRTEQLISCRAQLLSSRVRLIGALSELERLRGIRFRAV